MVLQPGLHWWILTDSSLPYAFLFWEETFLHMADMINFCKFLNLSTFSFDLKSFSWVSFANAYCTVAWNVLDSCSLFSFANNHGTVHQWRNPPIVTPPLLYWVTQKHHAKVDNLSAYTCTVSYLPCLALPNSVTTWCGSQTSAKLTQNSAIRYPMYYQDFCYVSLYIITIGTLTFMTSQPFVWLASHLLVIHISQ